MTPDLSHCSDGQLAQLAKNGRQDAFHEFLRRYKAQIFRLILHNVGDSDEALDLTQETFVAGFASLDRFDAARPFRAWISRIAINKCRDWARRRAVRSFFTRALPLDSAHDIATEDPGPDIEVADRHELARVRAAVARLPHKLREVLLLRGFEELSQAEAADWLQVSEKTIETRLQRARAQLKQLLGETADGPAA